MPPYSADGRASRSTGLRLGLVREHFGAGLDAEVEAAVREAVEVYESLGATVKEISLPHGKYGVATYYIIAPCEASSNLARYDGVHYGYRTDEADDARRAGRRANAAGSGRRHRPRPTSSTTPLVRMYRRSRAEGFRPRSEAADHARHVRPERRLLRRLLSEGPQGPAADPPGLRRGVRASRSDRRPGHAPRRRSRSAKRSTIRWRCTWSICTPSARTWPASAASRSPAASARAGLPIGLQLQGPPFEEERLLRAAHMFQQATDWHTRCPAAGKQHAQAHRSPKLATMTVQPYTTIIGLEVHVQLLTRTKLFCGCSTKFGAPPNTQTCPVCIGMPGTLPVMNRRAFELALQDGGGAQLRDRPVHQVGPQAVLLSRPAEGLSDQPVRSAVQPRRAIWRSAIPRGGSSRSGSASSAPIWKKTPARACTTKWPARPTAASI